MWPFDIFQGFLNLFKYNFSVSTMVLWLELHCTLKNQKPRFYVKLKASSKILNRSDFFASSTLLFNLSMILQKYQFFYLCAEDCSLTFKVFCASKLMYELVLMKIQNAFDDIISVLHMFFCPLNSRSSKVSLRGVQGDGAPQRAAENPAFVGQRLATITKYMIPSRMFFCRKVLASSKYSLQYQESSITYLSSQSWLLNLFHATGLCIPTEHMRKLEVSNVFRRYRKRPVT